MKTHKIIIIFGFLLLNLLLTINIAKADYIIDTNHQYIIGNVTYKVNDTTRTFNKIIYTNNYIVFNNTGFNITSTNPIMIYIDYINSSIIHAGNHDLVLEFVANTNAGLVTFVIDGMRNLQQYTVRRDGTSIATPTSTLAGTLTFTNNIWSNHTFTIFQGTYVTPTPATTTTINLVTYFPIFIVLALLLSLVVMMFVGMTDPKQLILWSIMFIVGIITIIIITT